MTMMCSTRSSDARCEGGGTAHDDSSAAATTAAARPRNGCTYMYQDPLFQRDAGAHGTGTIVPRGELNHLPRGCAHHPVELDAIVRDVVVRPERHARVLVRTAFELAGLLARLS